MSLEKLTSKDPLIQVVAMALGSGVGQKNEPPPVEVTLEAGEWLKQFLGNRQMLFDFVVIWQLPTSVVAHPLVPGLCAWL